MKHAHTQHGVRLLAFLTVLTLLALVFCSCASNGQNGVCTVVLMGETTKEYTVDLSEVGDKGGFKAVLDHLKETEGLTYTMNGTFLESIGSLKPDAGKHEYISVFTSVERDFDVTEWGSTTEYQGKTLTSSGVGLFDMSAPAGAVILFKMASY